MSSILTNNGAMVALQTLKGINASMAKTQSEISTGKSVANAKDNAAVWAISKVMEADVKGFKGISDSLALGASTVAVARNAAESVTDLLTEIKSKVVAAQEKNVDRAKIQTDISALKEQIKTVVGSAQFNGLNLVDGSSTQPVSILSSLDRNSSGVSASHITFDRKDLSVTNTAAAQVFGTTAVTDQTIIANGAAAAGTAATLATGSTQTISIASVADGNSYRMVLDDSAAGSKNIVGKRTFEYVANSSDSMESVAANLTSQISRFLGATGATKYSVVREGDAIKVTNNSGGDLSILAESATGGTSASTDGSMSAMNTIDVTTDAGATGALASIESLLNVSIGAAAAFGSVEKRIAIQSDFVGKLGDSLTSGVGSMVDANMEETSARLQALQVQQQLATQSLSIANQAPQALLSLFR